MLRDSLKNPIKWVVLLLLLFFWGRLVDTAATKSITYDEIKHIFQGALYWEGDELYSVVQNPPLVNAIIGLPVSLAFEPNLPHPIEVVSNWLKLSKAFMWEINNNGLQMIWAGRLGIMLLSVLLGALIYRWAGQLFQSARAGLLALLLYTFDPNILGHSFLATTDIGLAFFLALAAYFVWRYWRNPNQASPSVYLAAGLAIGMTLAAKFSGLIIVPALILIACYRWFTTFVRHNHWSKPISKQSPRLSLFRTAAELVGWMLIAGFVFLLIYRFDLKILRMDFAWQRDHQLNGHSAYFFGELGQEGWPLYFPIAFVIKTPIPVLFLLLIGGLLFFLRRQFDWERLLPLVIVAGFFLAGVFSRVNIGYRYLLPALPLLYVVLAQLGQPRYLRSRFAQAWIVAALVLTLFLSLMTHPHYLAYFNQLAGGPDDGWKILADSNIDWGQDLQALSEYLDQNKIDLPSISWFGTATLEAYGIQASSIPVNETSVYDPFYPERPSPGVYVLSVTQLLGVYLDNPDFFHWFQEQEPDDKVGYSLFIYDVPADGQPVGLALSGIGISAIDPEDFEQFFNSNDVRPRWYDARTSFVWPGGQSEAVWAAVGDGHWPRYTALLELYPSSGALLHGRGEDELDYKLFEIDDSPITSRLSQISRENTRFYYDPTWLPGASFPSEGWNSAHHTLTGTALFDDTLELLGYQLLLQGPIKPGSDLEMLSYWRIHRPPEGQFKAFIHLLDDSGELIAQNDALDVRMEGLMSGDEIAQFHAIELPVELPAGSYFLQIGLYDVGTQERLEVPVDDNYKADRLILEQVMINDE